MSDCLPPGDMFAPDDNDNHLNLRHEVPLTPRVSAFLELPRTFSALEANKLCEFILLISTPVDSE